MSILSSYDLLFQSPLPHFFSNQCYDYLRAVFPSGIQPSLLSPHHVLPWSSLQFHLHLSLPTDSFSMELFSAYYHTGKIRKSLSLCVNIAQRNSFVTPCTKALRDLHFNRGQFFHNSKKWSFSNGGISSITDSSGGNIGVKIHQTIILETTIFFT